MRIERFGVGRTRKRPNANWPWPGRLPDGPLILEGRGGLGKSMLTADLAARVSNGHAWPDGVKAKRGSGGVIIMSREDRREIQEERLVAAGADLSKIVRVSEANVAAEYDEFERTIKSLDAKLVVMDPANEFLGVPTRDEEQVRWILNMLDLTCEKYGVCMILIRHMRKDANDQDPMEDGGRGTGALRNWVRAVYRVILDPDDENKRLLMATKFNYGVMPSTLVFSQGNDKQGRPVIKWEKEPSRWNAFNLIARPKDEVKRYENRECDVWLKDYMRQHEHRAAAADVLKAGKELGFSASTVKRARVKLNIASTKVAAFQGQYLWTDPLYDPENDDGPLAFALAGIPMLPTPLAQGGKSRKSS